MTRKKILIAGASTYGVGNMGDDAMLYNLTSNLHKATDCEITFLARHPDMEYDKLFNFHSIKNYEFDTREQSIGKFFNGFNFLDNKGHLKGIREAVEQADLVIIGGNSFMEIFPNQFMRGVTFYSALLAIFAVLFEKPYMLYGVAGHQIKEDATIAMAKFLCENASLITVRENFFKNALNEIGCKTDNVYVCGDPAYGVIESSQELGREILKKSKIPFNQKRNVAIAFRHMYWVWNESEYNLYAKKLANICDYMIETHDVNIVFIANCNYTLANPLQDDRVVAEKIISFMKNKQQAFNIHPTLNLKETVSLYPLMDMVITNRRHSSIFAAVNKIPFLAMSSGHPWQFLPFMQDLGIDEYCIDFVTNSFDEIIDMIEKIYTNKEQFTKSYQSNMEQLITNSKSHIELIQTQGLI
jgi:polysaccharide pyruvyl transferase WcaK-like protein